MRNPFKKTCQHPEIKSKFKDIYSTGEYRYFRAKHTCLDCDWVRITATPIPITATPIPTLKTDDTVMIYDRYRFAIALKARVIAFAKSNDGVEVELLTSNAVSHPIGRRIWVSEHQIRPLR